MRILTNELKSAKLLRRAGFSPKKSEAIMAMMTGMEIHNLYSSEEIDIMLSEAVEKVFENNREMLKEQRREFDTKIKERRRELETRLSLLQNESLETRQEQRRELDARLSLAQNESRETRQEQRQNFELRFSQFHDEIKSSRRWLIGTIVTVGMGLAAYLSALIKLSH